MAIQVTRIVLEPTEDGSRFTVNIETDDDTEGHGNLPLGRLEIEPLEDEADGEPTYRLTIDGEDVEGHAKRWSDRRLKMSVIPVTW